MNHRSNAVARIFTAGLESLHELRDRYPEDAEAIRCALVAELVAMTQGERSMTERANSED